MMTTSAYARCASSGQSREARHASAPHSYLLFDGDFGAELIELGRRDAAKEDELAALFDVTSESRPLADAAVVAGHD